MRRLNPALALMLLSLGAAAAPPTKPAPRTPAPKAPADPTTRLAGSTLAQVKAQLGEPAVASQEGKGALWTYRFEDCAVMVFFKDQGRGLRVSGLSAAPRRRGDPVPEVSACLEEAG